VSSEPAGPAGPQRRPGRLRLVLLPLVLIVGVTAIVYAVARARPLEKGAPAPSGTVALGDAASGRALFLAKCAGCHGAQAQGGVGPKLAGSGIALSAAQGTIESGRGVMPAGLVSGREESDVLAYLDTILAGGGATTGGAGTAAPPVTTAPATTGAAAGDAERGAATFASTCSGCHGDGGAGGVAPRLRGASIGVDEARTIITNGRGGMPAGLVSGATLEDVLAYLHERVFAAAGAPAAGGGTATLSGAGLSAVRLALTSPAPAGWRAWLEGAGGRDDLGPVPAGATRASLAGGGATPLGGGEVRVSVGRDAGRPALTGTLDPTVAEALTRLVLRDPSTPGRVALLAGAGDGAAVFARWTGLLIKAVDAGDLAGIHRSAEAVVNVVRGGPGRDVDGDGRVEAPGDGHGLLATGAGGYVDQERDVAQTVARVPGLDPAALRGARLVDGAGRATARFLGYVVLAAERLAVVPTPAGARADARTVDGYDGRIVAGQARVAQYTPLMAVIRLAPPGGG
jgi:mono/diheme cytochrome c family protein